MNRNMTDNPLYTDLIQHIEHLHAADSHLQAMMYQAPLNRNPFSSTNRYIRAQKFQSKVINKKVDYIYDLLNKLQIEWENASVW
jgi:hypothetical protein